MPQEKPPEGWWNQATETIRKGMPEYSEEQVNAVAGYLWYRKGITENIGDTKVDLLSDSKKITVKVDSNGQPFINVDAKYNFPKGVMASSWIEAAASAITGARSDWLNGNFDGVQDRVNRAREYLKGVEKDLNDAKKQYQI